MEAVKFFRNIAGFFVHEEKIINFEDKLFLNKSKMNNFDKFLEYSIIEGIILMVFSMVGLWIFSTDQKTFLLGIIFLFAPFFLNYVFIDVIFEKRKRKKEDALPDLLLEGSVFCDQKSLLKTIHSFSEQEIPLLSGDFKRVYSEIKNGSSIEEALQRNKKLNKSKAYDRVTNLLLQGYSSGGEMSVLMRELAEDLMESKSILRERQAVMLVTKYTLLLSAGIIVPAILGTIIGMVSGLSFGTTDLGLGLSAIKREELFSLSVLGTTIYIFEYCILSSFFLSLQEGNKKQFWVYILFLIPCGAITFIFAQSLLIT